MLSLLHGQFLPFYILLTQYEALTSPRPGFAAFRTVSQTKLSFINCPASGILLHSQKWPETEGLSEPPAGSEDYNTWAVYTQWILWIWRWFASWVGQHTSACFPFWWATKNVWTIYFCNFPVSVSGLSLTTGNRKPWNTKQWIRRGVVYLWNGNHPWSHSVLSVFLRRAGRLKKKKKKTTLGYWQTSVN